MFEIKDLVYRFKNILLSAEFKIVSIQKVIFEVVNININKEDIKLRNNIVYLNIKPIYKNEVFLKKQKILERLSEVFEKNPPTDIK